MEYIRFPGEQAAGRDGTHTHLVRINSNGRDARDCKVKGDGVFEKWDHHTPKGCIYMEEYLVCICDLCQISNRVNHAIFGSAGDTYKTDRVPVNLLSRFFCVHPEISTKRYGPYLKTEEIAGLPE